MLFRNALFLKIEHIFYELITIYYIHVIKVVTCLGRCLAPEILDKIKNNIPINAAIAIQNIITMESKIKQSFG